MKKFGVELPIFGKIYLEVEADNKNDAIKKALQVQWKDEDIIEIDSYEKIVRGNVMCVSGSEADAFELKEEVQSNGD